MKKKLITLLLIAFVLFTAASCSDGQDHSLDGTYNIDRVMTSDGTVLDAKEIGLKGWIKLKGNKYSTMVSINDSKADIDGKYEVKDNDGNKFLYFYDKNEDYVGIGTYVESDGTKVSLLQQNRGI